jgi:DNA-binding transcriptional LysR family regulator
MLSLKLLESFYWVAKLRNFHAAAVRLRLTQPAISYRVKELEAQIGRPLIVRGGRAMRLTAQGQKLLEQAERMLTAAQDLDRQFRQSGTLTGALRLGVTDAFAVICLPHLLRLMATEHPDLDVSVAVDNSHVLTRKLDEGELDLALVSTPPLLPGLRYEPVGEQRVGWVGSTSAADARQADAAWIAGSRIFVTPPPSNLDAITAGWFHLVGLELPRLSVCNSMSAIIGLVQAGAGIGILPLRMVEASIQAGVLIHLDVPGGLPPQAVFIAYSRGALDAALPLALEALRRSVLDQRFCDGSRRRARRGST